MHCQSKPSDDLRSIRPANGSNFSRWTACTFLLAVLASSSPLRGESLYWDGNGDVAGAGAAPAGDWGADSFWSSIFDGTLATGPWVEGGNAIFSAGIDATGPFTVVLSAPQTAGSLSFEEGGVLLSGATPATNLTWNGSVDVAGGASATLNTLLLGGSGLTKSGAGTLILGATNNFTGSVAVNAGILGFSSDAQFGAIPVAFTADAISLADGTILRFSGGIVTFATNRGLTLNGTVTLECTTSILLSESPIAGPGATLLKTGPAEFRSYRLPNSFGRLVVNQGTYTAGTSTFAGLDESFGAVPAVPTPDAITISNAATLRTVGGTPVTISANRGITIGPGGATLHSDVQPVTINSPITGDGGLTKTGNRNWTNNGTISYSGPTTINGGTASSFAIVALNGFGAATGPLTLNAGRILANNANAFSSVTIVTGRIDANTNGALGSGTITFSPTNNVVFVNSTTLGVGPITNVTLNNDIVMNVGATLAGGTTFVDMSANSGREFILNGKITGGGAWKKDNSGSTGTLVLGNANNDFTANVTNFGGTLIAAAGSALGSTAGITVINSGSSLAFRGGINYGAAEPVIISGNGRLSNGAISNDSGNNTFSGPVTLAADSSVGGAPGTVLTLSGVIGESGGARVLTKSTAGTVQLTADNQYTGGTIISGGTLVAANTTGSATGPGPVSILAGGSFSGPGSVAGTLTINGNIAPGSSPGTLNTGSEIWNGGGTYVWEINDVDAGQGTDPGWDLVNITGTLAINATPAGKFNIDIRSLDLTGAEGSVADFDSSADYIWTILKTTGGITGFDPAAFNVISSGFGNPLGTGSFLVETSNGGNDLVIRFVRAPAIAVQPGNQSAECATGSATFSVIATGTAPLSYQWRLNGTDIGGANAATLTINPTLPAAAGNYDVVVANGFGSVISSVAILSLTDTVAPVITTCAPNQTLDADANCQVAIPDLTGLVTASDTCSMVTLSQSPAAGMLVGAGTHAVTISVKDAANNTTTCTANVTVNDTTAPVITTCAPNQTITAGGVNCTAAIPDLTGLVTATDTCGPVTVTQSPIAGTLVAVGAHTVTLTATDAANNSATCQSVVTVNSSVSVAVNSPTICAGSSAMLTATTTAANPTYLWSPGGETTASITVSPASTTIYSVTVTDGTTTCSASASGTVTIDSTLSVAVNSSAICVGGSATLTASSAAASPTYLWSPGGETTASITVSPASTATYSVTVTDGVAGCSASGSGTVTVNPLPTVAVNSETICPGTSATLTATTAAANPTYLWSPGGETTASITVSPAATTVYSVTVTDGTTTCAGSASGTVTVSPAPNVAVNSETICAGGSATLMVTTAAANPSYLWSPGGETTASITVSPATTTIYSVTVTDGVTTCAASSSGTVTVNPLPTVTVNSPTICAGDTAVLTATTSAANPSYLWSPGGETTASITVSPAATTTYTVTVTDGTTTCAGTGSGSVTVKVPEVFAQTNPVTISDNSVAAPYPSSINVSGLTSTVCKITVTLNNLSHAFPDDIDMVLVGPDGQGVLLMSDVGGGNAVNGLTLTFDDTAASSLPDSAQIISGVFKPTNIGAKIDGLNDVFAAPAPQVYFSTNLSYFSGINPNGTWSLYCVDDEPLDSGSIAGGWSIAITTVTPFADVAVSQSPIPNPVAIGSNLTYAVTVANEGPATALDIALTDTLPAGVTFVSATSAAGSCAHLAGTVTCQLGSLNAGANAVVTIVVIPTTLGSLVNQASASSTTLDFVAGNNSSSSITTVLEPPSITVQPIAQVACAGGTISFAVTATGAAPLSYQWYKNDMAIGAATADSLTITSAQPSDSGNYTVVVNNSVGAVLSSVAVGTVNPNPVVTVNSETICLGGSATLTAAHNAANPIYLWSPGGATTASITVTPDSTTTYTVTVTDGATGCFSSGSGTVTVNPLTVASALQSYTDVCPGGSVTFSTVATGTEPLSYVWLKNGSVLAGETGSAITIPSVTLADAGTYTVEVTGGCSSVTNSGMLTVVVPPIFAAQPQNQTTPMGNGAVFSLTAGGVGPFTYQWQLNGADITGATSTSLAVSNVTLAQSGEIYSVVVSNCAGTTLSASAILTVTPISGISFDFDSPGQYTNAPYYLTYNNWINGGYLPGALSAPTVFEAAIGGVGPFPGSGSLDMAPNQGTESTSILLPVNFDFSLTGRTIYASTMFKVKTPVAAGRRATQFGLVTSTNLGINDQNPQGFATVILQNPTAGTPSFELRTQRRLSTGGLQESVVVPATPLTVSNWYKLNVTFLNTKSGTSPSGYTISASVQDMGPLGTTPGATNMSFTTTTNNADIVNFKNVHLALRSFEDGGMEARDNTYVWTTPGNIFFVQELQSQTALQGQRVVFKALVDGEGPYTYQWSRNGTPIPGARSWNYITPPTTTADNGALYTVEVTGPANTINSSAATLTVTPQTLAVVSAGSVDGTTVGVLFNQPVDPASAENVANYTINGANPVQARVYRSSLGTQGPDGIYVILTPGTVLSGSFTVTASGILDLSGGAVGGANSASGSVAGLTGFDVNPGVTGPPGENYSFGPGQFIVTGGGSDIFSGGDGFRYVYTTQTGDFDVTIRIPHMDTVRFTAKAGIDARFSLDPFSPGVFAGFDPGPMAEGSSNLRQFTEGTAKQTWGAGGTSWGTGTRLFHPDVWVRFRRSGNNFMRYSSSNGINWAFDGQIQPFTAFAPQPTLYLGLAVCSARNLVASSARFENYGAFGGYPGAAIVIQTQPTNITVAAGSAANIGGLVATASGGGIPAVGELAYVWQRSDGADGWTNMPTAGATNNILAAGNVFGSDNGAQFRAILLAPGALSVTSSVATLTVTDAAVPTLTSVNAAVLPSYPAAEVVLNFSEPLTSVTATDIANFTVTNSAGVRLTVLSAAFLGADLRTVVLKVDGLLGSGTSSVGVSGLRDLNNNLLATTTRTFRSFLPSTGPVVVEVYQDVGTGTTIPDLTGNALYTGGTPTFICYSNLFGYNVGMADVQNSYGVKAYTYFVPPTNGNYKFWIRGDDALQLRMNTNGTSPADTVLIAQLTAFSANYSVGTVPANSITNIALVAGQSYYMEFLLKENSGGDGGSVMWTAPTVNTAPAATAFIPTANLAYPASAAPSTPVVMDIYTGYQNFLAGFNQMAGLTAATNFPTDNYAINVVNFKYIAGLADVIGYQKYFGVQPVTLGNTRLDNYLGRIQTYFIAPSNGLYRFWLAVDDVAQLYMNTNAVNSTDPAGMVMLGQSANAFVSTASQLVAQNVPLVGGQKYYMMALWREGSGGDGVRVAVRSQGDTATPPTTEVIPAGMLEYPLAVGRAGAVNIASIAPVNPTVVDGRTLTLSVAGVSGAVPYGGFTWLKNGVPVRQNSFTNYTPPLTMADNGAVYTVVVTNAFSRAERSVTVTVLPDGAAPTIVRTVGRRYNDGFTIVFSEPMDAASATYLGNYQISGGLILRSATLDPSRTMVSVETSAQAVDTTYTVTLNGVRDASSSGNLIAPNTITSFSTWSVGGSGFMVELFTNIQGTAITDLTGTPKFAANLPDVVYYTNVFGAGAFAANSGLENYGARISGYFIPTSTGYYRFFIRSDDASQFSMNINSTGSENPAGKTMLLHMPNANININDARSISVPVALNQGQRYYVESLLKEGGGGDYVQVTFRPSDALGNLAANPVDNTVNENSTIGMFGGAGAPGNPDLIQILQTPPSDVFVTENEQVSLKLVVSVPANVLLATSYQWQKFDGLAYTNIPGATASTLNFFANLSDDLAQYRVLFSAPGRSASYVTTLHVSLDSEAPYIVSASSLDGTRIGLCFSERITQLTAQDAFVYTVNGGANNVVLAEQRADGKTVIVTVEPPLTGPFTIKADGIWDLATTVNVGTSTTNGTIQGFNAPADVGAPTAPGSSFSCVEGEIDVFAGGADIWTTADQGHLTLATRTGDFDVHVRVQSLSRSGTDNSSKAGLMVRESMEPGSRTMNYLVTPPLSIGGRNIHEASQRPSLNAATAAWAGGNDSAAPSTIPDAWVRIKREGALFTGYRSTNGHDWIMTTTNVMPMSNTVLVGFATTAHNNAGPAVLAEYRNVYLPLPPTILVQPAPGAQIIPLGGSAAYSVVVSNPPNAGPLKLQWLKNGVVIPGATAATLSLNNLNGSDTGLYTVDVANDGGNGDRSSPALLIVANDPPLVTGESLTTTQGVSLTLTGSSLLANDTDPEGATLSLLGVNGICSGLVRANFESGLPPNSAIYSGALGGASIDVNGGTGDSRVLKLTSALGSQAGSIVFGELGAGAPMAGFTASFNLRIGDGSGEPADGFSFNFGSDLPDDVSSGAENGVGSGFSFCIDNYRFAPYPGGGTAGTSGMKIRYAGMDIAGVQAPTWNSPAYIPVSLTLAPDGTLTVLVDGTNVFGNVVLPYVPAAGRFGIYARTGGQYQSHRLDDLSITPVYRTPNGGLVSLNSGTGDITYTPPVGYCGLDTFAYLVNDGQEGGNTCGLVNVRVIESTLVAPVITSCATNRTLLLVDANPIPLPDLTSEVSASDNCCCVTITQSPAPDTLVGAGPVVVTLTATDIAGLTATCQATVTVLPTGPALTGSSYNGGVFSSSFASVNGLTYTVEYKDRIDDPSWTTLSIIPGDGSLKTFTDPGPLPATRFYRVTVSP